MEVQSCLSLTCKSQLADDVKHLCCCLLLADACCMLPECCADDAGCLCHAWSSSLMLCWPAAAAGWHALYICGLGSALTQILTSKPNPKLTQTLTVLLVSCSNLCGAQPWMASWQSRVGGISARLAYQPCPACCMPQVMALAHCLLQETGLGLSQLF